jgi:hypothetical protein
MEYKFEVSPVTVSPVPCLGTYSGHPNQEGQAL